MALGLEALDGRPQWCAASVFVSIRLGMMLSCKVALVILRLRSLQNFSYEGSHRKNGQAVIVTLVAEADNLAF